MWQESNSDCILVIRVVNIILQRAPIRMTSTCSVAASIKLTFFLRATTMQRPCNSDTVFVSCPFTLRFRNISEWFRIIALGTFNAQ